MRVTVLKMSIVDIKREKLGERERESIKRGEMYVCT